MTIKNSEDFVLERKTEEFAAPSIAVIQVGPDDAIEREAAEFKTVGFDAHWYYFEETIDTDELLNEIQDLVDFYDLVVIYPHLPLSINKAKVQKYFLNVDMSEVVIDYLRYCNVKLEGTSIAIVSEDGIDLAEKLMHEGATVIYCNEKTNRFYQHLFTADLIICTIEKKDYLNCYPLLVPIIDIGGSCYNAAKREVIPAGILKKLALYIQLEENMKK